MRHSIMEGTAPWSVALVGKAIEMPIEFFMGTVSAGHVINLEEEDGGSLKSPEHFYVSKD